MQGWHWHRSLSMVRDNAFSSGQQVVQGEHWPRWSHVRTHLPGAEPAPVAVQEEEQHKHQDESQ